jgi:hypothetical protein
VISAFTVCKRLVGSLIGHAEAAAAHLSQRPNDAVQRAGGAADRRGPLAVADQQGWLVSEALEQALAALKRELAGQSRGQ